MTTMGLALGLVLAGSGADAKAGGTLQWVGCDVAKASFMEAVAAAYEKKSGVHIELNDGGATKGIREVAAKKASMGGTCRHALNVPEEQGARLVPVAWDALVIAVHPSNPVTNITLEQIKGVYLGKITNWKELGGNDAPIVPLERKGKMSGVGFGARQLIFKNAEQDYAPSVKLFDSTRPMEEAAEGEVNGISITGISSGRVRKLKLLSIEGKSPTRENFVSGDYMLYRPLYLTVPKDADPKANDFLKYILSGEGQAVIAKTGTINLADGKLLWAKFKAQYGDFAKQ